MQKTLPSRALMTAMTTVAAIVAILAAAFAAPHPVSAAARGTGPVEDAWPLASVGAPVDRPDGDGVRVAVVDSGIDASHPAFAGRIAAAADCLGADGDPKLCASSAGAVPAQLVADDNGHGTHIAGIIAAAEGDGYEGVAPAAELLVARSLRNTCEREGDSASCRAIGELGDVVAGVRWATAQRADLINLSIDAGVELDWSGGSLASAIRDAWKAGAVVVASTGNRSAVIEDPALASVPLVLVGALTIDGEIASYSNRASSARWPLLAPGGEAGAECPAAGVLSTYPVAVAAAGTGCLSGTSMAAAYVTGMLASLMTGGADAPSALAHLLSTGTVREGGIQPDLQAALDDPIDPAPPALAAGLTERAAGAGTDSSSNQIFSASGLALENWTRVHPMRTRAIGMMALTIGMLLLVSRNRRSAGLC